MRPVRLQAEGFTAFRERVVVDFEGVDFFALVGPTGSGKSSVIDAICFALYGCVPRYEDRRQVAPAITVGASEAKVSLVFDAAGARYQATRVVRRVAKGGATTREARLERLAPGGAAAGEVLAGTADELGAAVEGLLGLSFEHFTRCVVLPQGEFARFLHDKPADRQQLLAKLLDIEVYARIGSRARQRATEHANAATLLRQRLDQLAGATPGALVEAAARAARLEQLATSLKDLEPELAGLQRDLDSAAESARAALALAERLAEVPVPAAVRSLVSRVEELGRREAGAVEELAAATAARLAAEEAAAALPEPAPLELARQAHADLHRLEAELAKDGETLAEAGAYAGEAAAQAEVARGRLSEAREALELARRAHSAAHLATSLVVGQPCPVCAAVVVRLPGTGPVAALDRAEAELDAAEVSARRAEQAAAAAAAELTRREERRLAHLEQLAEAQARTAGHPDAAALEAVIEQALSARRDVAERRSAEEAARSAREETRQALAATAGPLGEARDELRRRRESLAPVELPEPTGDLLADWSALERAAGAAHPAQLQRAEDAVSLARRLDERRRQRIGELLSACAAAGVDVGSSGGGGGPVDPAAADEVSLADLRAATAGSLAEARAAERLLGEQIGEAERLGAEAGRLEGQAQVAALLASQLSARGFERWLVAEALELLVAGASATLRELSGGQYSLARDDKGDFLVVDHRNADERRPAKTLSGGETFQASLALALALADQLAGLAAGGAARLESIFLDEGFGTLDPESLATVADTVEALGSGDRLVGLVTHVRELADRVPVRYDVAKDGRTSTVARRVL